MAHALIRPAAVSQNSVELVIGKLVTDEAFRRSFTGNPGGTLSEWMERGLELNPCEQRALTALDPELLERFSRALDPRIQKIDPIGEES